MHQDPRRRARRAAALSAALVLALGLAACGAATVSTGSFKGEQRAVAQRIADFQADATAGDEQKVCANDLAGAVKAKLLAAGESCTKALARQLGQIDTVDLTVQSVAVTGATATARVKSTWSGKSTAGKLALVKEGGAWRIAALR
ncbi:MAG TPA: nuclear transport factor 2 family protein [Solirubrobacteraceae bacterium]